MIYPDILAYHLLVKKYGNIDNGLPPNIKINSGAYIEYIKSLLGESEVILPSNAKLVIHDTYKRGDFGGDVSSDTTTHHCSYVQL